MNLARAIHFDESDRHVYANPARTGEWCVSGGFEFSDWSEADLTGKARQAFANGWLGLETGGRVTFVAVTAIEPAEIATLTDLLAEHFVIYYGAPSAEEARPVAAEEISQMADLCAEHPPNTLLVVARDLSQAGVRETYRIIETSEASLEQFAIHGNAEEQAHVMHSNEPVQVSQGAPHGFKPAAEKGVWRGAVAAVQPRKPQK